jgi:hypothetical protein
MPTITLTENCPACTAAGKMNRLLQNIGDDDFYCTKGHKFPTFEAVENYHPAAPATPPLVMSKSVQKRIAIQKGERPAAVTGPPADLAAPGEDLRVLDEEIPTVEPEPAPTPAPAPPVPAEPPQPEPEPEPEPVVPSGHSFHYTPEQPKVQHVPDSARLMPGGTLAVTILVPDQYVSFVQSISQEHGKTVEEYLNEVISFAFENRWFF